MAEHLKRTGTDAAELSVGVGEVVLERVVDLTTPEALKAVGVTLEDITLDRDHRIPHRIATRLYADGITGLLAPAAWLLYQDSCRASWSGATNTRKPARHPR